jgi:CHAD domain-containing protein
MAFGLEAREEGHAYALEGSKDVARVLDGLRAHFQTEVEREERRRILYLDTFDARLFRAGLALGVATDREGLLLCTTDGRVLERLARREPPGFAWDLPLGRLRSLVESAIDVRRLLPLVEVDHRVKSLRVLDAEEKTVARLQLVEGVAHSPNGNGTTGHLPRTLRVQPVKGYDAALAQVISFLESELRLYPAHVDDVGAAVASTGRGPLEDPSRLKVLLDPRQPAADAMRALHRALLAMIRANEKGVRERLDTEFLHDFRVAVRRIRSALSQVKDVFPSDVVATYRDEFSWLGAMTGPARDADVFLLKLPRYRAQLPDDHQGDLDAFEVFLNERQVETYGVLRKALGSKRYTALLERWEEFLATETANGASASNAARPVLEVASARIHAAARRVLEKGRKIDPDTPPDALHRLRIACKKLRYLLDLFRSLYPPDDVAELIRVQKKLQDNLGDYNDCAVQQEALVGHAHEMARNASTAPVDALLAMGRVAEGLRARGARHRKDFARRFARFDAKENRERFERLFGGEEPS